MYRRSLSNDSLKVMSKLERRNEMKAKLSLIDEADLKNKSSQLSRNLLQLFSDLHVIQKNILIGGFAPFNGEPYWHSELTEDFDRLTAFPAFDDSSIGMKFKKAEFRDLEIRTDFGSKIAGPKDEAEVARPGIILVPGLAMSSKGERLGRGKGFYDRYLAGFRGIKIGVCLEVQLDEGLPLEAHDVLLDYVVTEKRIINCRNA